MSRYIDKQFNRLIKKNMSKDNIAETKKLLGQIIDGFDGLGEILADEKYIGSDINKAANIVEQFYKDLFYIEIKKK
jgi:hypothetical protein